MGIVNARTAAGIPVLRHYKNGIRVAVALRIINSGGIADNVRRGSLVDECGRACADARAAHVDCTTANGQRRAAAGGINSRGRSGRGNTGGTAGAHAGAGPSIGQQANARGASEVTAPTTASL